MTKDDILNAAMRLAELLSVTTLETADVDADSVEVKLITGEETTSVFIFHRDVIPVSALHNELAAQLEAHIFRILEPSGIRPSVPPEPPEPRFEVVDELDTEEA